MTSIVTVLAIYMNYRLFIGTNSDYDAEEEIRKGNTGVAILLSAMLIGGGSIVRQGIFPVVNLVRLHYTAPIVDLGGLEILAFVAGHLFLVFFVAVASLSLALRCWGRLTAPLQNGDQLRRGNTAVGVVLAGVVLVVSLFMSDGVSRLTKALIPQPSMGQVKISD